MRILGFSAQHSKLYKVCGNSMQCLSVSALKPLALRTKGLKEADEKQQAHTPRKVFDNKCMLLS